jgi:hypothetical protein
MMASKQNLLEGKNRMMHARCFKAGLDVPWSFEAVILGKCNTGMGWEKWAFFSSCFTST